MVGEGKSIVRVVSLFVRMSTALLVLGIALAACSPAAPASPTAATTPPASSVVATSPASGLTSPVAKADAGACPVTKPGEAPSEIGERLFGSASAFGNSELWVGGLGADGVIAADSRFVESDGSIGWKFGWWRVVPGTLTITGRRLDAPAPPLRAAVPDGYGQQGFQASGVYFSTEGCWEVSGTVGSSELTFVTFVLRT